MIHTHTEDIDIKYMREFMAARAVAAASTAPIDGVNVGVKCFLQ